MSTVHLPYIPSYPVEHQLLHDFIENKLGDGYVQVISHEQAFSRADGEGNNSSYKGLNRFVIRFKNTLYGNNKLASQLWSFFKARMNNMNEPFFFYNPIENLSMNNAPTNTTGRYLVRLEDPSQAMSRSQFAYCAFSYDGIALIESREAPVS